MSRNAALARVANKIMTTVDKDAPTTDPTEMSVSITLLADEEASVAQSQHGLGIGAPPRLVERPL